MSTRAIVITGAASGIGRATALEFAKQGDHIVLSDINIEGGQETLQLIRDLGVQAHFIKVDVSVDAEVKAMTQLCIDKFGRLDVMVNNAGIGLDLKYFDQIEDDHWHKVIAINQTGVFYCMRAALKIMVAQKGGCMINIASAAGIGAAPRMGAYAASKHAVVGMTKTAAHEYGKFNIRINCVCPSVIETPMGDGYVGAQPELKSMMLQAVPMRRFGKSEEVAKTIAWLSSSDASYINGVAMRIDGGFRA